MLYLNNHKDVMLLSVLQNCNLSANWRKIGFILEVDSLQKHTIILNWCFSFFLFLEEGGLVEHKRVINRKYPYLCDLLS